MGTATLSKGSTEGLYAHYSNDILIEAYKKGYERIMYSIQGLDEENIKARPVENKWSIAEILIHLSESELIGACRIKQVLMEHPDPLPYYFEDKWARELNYQSHSYEYFLKCLELFRLLRETTIVYLLKCTEKEWTKTGFHPQRGEVTLRELLEIYADHSERHIEQILVRRKFLGKELEMTSILKDRLY